MGNFIKYYSYNQVIENFDVLIMTEQEYLANKNKLDNPQKVVIVNRANGPRKPKMPEWFKQWSENVYEKKQPEWFKQWSENVYEKKQPEWFKQWSENVYEKKQPEWFKTWHEQEFKPLVKRIDNLVLKNNLKE